jgi:putative membrane protein
MKRWILESIAVGTLVALGSTGAVSQTYSKPSPTTNQTNAAKQNASASQPAGREMTAADKAFIKNAAEGGMAEVEMGKLAQQQAANSAVKDFGKRMVADHGKADEQLRSIASRANIAWPSGLSRATKTEQEKLAKLHGPAFDKAYMNEMLKDHRADSLAFQREIDSTRNSDVKEFASNTLVVIKDHLRLAEDTAPKVGIAVTKTTAQLR